MNTPRKNWFNQSKIMKKNNLMAISNTDLDMDDTDLDFEDEYEEIEIEREKKCKGNNCKIKKKSTKNNYIDSMMEDLEESRDSCCTEDSFVSMKKDCGCDTAIEPQCPSNLMFAHTVIPVQNYTKAYTPDVAIKKGTLFPELWCVYPVPK